MSLATIQSQKKQIWLFLIAALFVLSACEKKAIATAELDDAVPDFGSAQAIDATNLISLATLGKTTIRANDELGLKNSNNRIVNFSKVIAGNQDQLMESVNKAADSKLIIINSIVPKDIELDSALNERFYFETVENNLEKQISILESLKLNTQDTVLSEFAEDQLKKQEHILELTRKFKIKIESEKITQIE